MRFRQLTYLSLLVFIGACQVEKTPDTDTAATAPTECTVLADNDVCPGGGPDLHTAPSVRVTLTPTRAVNIAGVTALAWPHRSAWIQNAGHLNLPSSS